MAVQIKKCNCKGTPGSEYQDKTYGQGMRVMNEEQGGKQATCTVCGTKHKL